MYIYTPLCRYWIALYRYILIFIVPRVDIVLEDNKQFISNIPRISFYGDASVEPLNGICDCKTGDLPPQMTLFNAVIPILMHLFICKD